MQLTVFEGHRCLATGPVAQAAAAAQAATARGATPLVLDDATGRAVDLDLRGSAEEAAERLAAARAAPAPARRGRPKLGVTSREISLLPRHWAWLAAQRGGASASLRRLVEEAMRADTGSSLRARQDRTYAAATALAGDLPGYEEAMRQLFAPSPEGFAAAIAPWPRDVSAYLLRLAAPAAG